MRGVRLLWIGVWIAANAVACGPHLPPTAGSASAIAASAVAITHAAGTTTVTGIPQRVVALGPIPVESLLAIGIRPAATTEFSHPSASQPLLEQPPYLRALLEGVPTVGGRTDPDIEAVIAQRPDVVLGTDDQMAGYAALAHAAPTVLFGQGGDWQTPQAQEPWRRAMLTIGQLFEREAQARQRLAEYDAAAAAAATEIRAAIGTQTVLLVRTLAKGVRVHGRSHPTMGHVLYRDLGCTPPPDMPREYRDQYVSTEELVRYDPDHIFLIRGNPELTAALLEGPVWSHLRAVRAGHVYDVHLYWIRGHGWYGKMAIVQDALHHLAAGR